MRFSVYLEQIRNDLMQVCLGVKMMYVVEIFILVESGLDMESLNGNKEVLI